MTRILLRHWVKEFSRETESIGIRFIIRNWLMELWRLRVPLSSICKLESQEGQQCSLKARERWCRFQSKNEGLRIRSVKGGSVSQLSQSGREWIQPSFTFLFYSGPQRIGWCPPTLGRAICFTQFTNSNANLFQKHSQTHLEITLNQIPGHPVAQWNWLIKLTITDIFL